MYAPPPRVIARAIRALIGVFALPLVSAAQGFVLPAPLGPHSVGTTSFVLRDESRPETFTDRGEIRQIPVTVWYPSASTAGQAAPYLRQGIDEARTFATLIGKAGAFDDLADVKTHAQLDSPLVAMPAKLPVLVFSHGFTGIPSSHTALLEDLASHGYVVLSVVHPFEATAALLANGQTVTMLDASGGLRKELGAIFGEWSREDEIMKAVTEAGSEKDQLKLLRDYFSGLRGTGEALTRWVKDTKFVLDRVSSLPPATAAGRVAARLDLARVGVFGHSMGGVAAGQFCLEDSRCLAGLNLDGIPQSGGLIDGRLKRPFLMVYSSRPGRLGANDPIYAKAASPYFRVDVKDTRHLDFSDLPFWPGSGLRERGAFGSITPGRATMITRMLVREYFDLTLLKRPSPLLDGGVILSDVTVHLPNQKR